MDEFNLTSVHEDTELPRYVVTYVKPEDPVITIDGKLNMNAMYATSLPDLNKDTVQGVCQALAAKGWIPQAAHDLNTGGRYEIALTRICLN